MSNQVNNFLKPQQITPNTAPVNQPSVNTDTEQSSQGAPTATIELPAGVKNNALETEKAFNDIFNEVSKLPTYDTSAAEKLIHEAVAKNNGKLPKGEELNKLVKAVEGTAKQVDTTLQRNRDLEQQVRTLNTKLQSANSRLALEHSRDRSFISEQNMRKSIQGDSVEASIGRVCDQALQNIDSQIRNLNTGLEKKTRLSSLSTKLEAILNSDDFRGEKEYNFYKPKAGHEARSAEVISLANEIKAEDPDFTWEKRDGFLGWKSKEGREAIVSELADRRMVNSSPEKRMLIMFQKLLSDQQFWTTLWTNCIQKLSESKRACITNINR